jgi:hypothetical protein
VELSSALSFTSELDPDYRAGQHDHPYDDWNNYIDPAGVNVKTYKVNSSTK